MRANLLGQLEKFHVPGNIWKIQTADMRSEELLQNQEAAGGPERDGGLQH
jgi:hypothetical protein